MQVDDQSYDGLYRSIKQYGCGPYEPSIASTASSSQSSIFSDEASTQSSIASSISDDFRHNQEDARDRAFAQAQIQQKYAAETYTAEQQQLAAVLQGSRPAQPSYADVTSVPIKQRQHPRRCSLSRNQKPPTLQRQYERKESFVNDLVDSATQMVEVIWPLSNSACPSEGNSGRGVLPLRNYIEETLRRSKTSYSTLQVALYYLVLIKPFVPKTDFTHEQRTDCPANRALMCGRRMFLAALILASKYLQDRNYSAKAWSKMSGLRADEINAHERTFLEKVKWKLHIPEPLFRRWQEVVLDFTPNTPPSPPGAGFGILPPSWKAIIPLLTPELDKVPSVGLRHKRSMQCVGNYGLPTPVTPTKPTVNFPHFASTSQEGTPTPTTVIPRFLEPAPNVEPPQLPRMGPLPTPQMTPSIASSTPAASTCGSRRPSICSAMAMAQKTGFNRCTMDGFPGMFSRRPSITSASTFSSPESMVSDRSRSSRASSISSVSTVSTTSSAVAPTRPCFVRQATCRNAGLPPPPPFYSVAEEKENECSPSRPTILSDEILSSPVMADFSISEKVLSRPDKHTKHAPQPVVAPANVDKGRKRVRNSHGSRRSNLQDEIRWAVEEYEEELDEDCVMDDRSTVSPSPAVDCARTMLSRDRSNSTLCVRTKEVQPPASLSRSGSNRMPVARQGGEKRRCCSTAAATPFMREGSFCQEVA